VPGLSYTFCRRNDPETSKRRSSLRSCHRQRNRRTSAVCYCYDPRHDHRHHDRCERALFPEESADGHYHRRGPHDELRSRAPRSNAKKRTVPRTQLRNHGKRNYHGRRSRLGQPQRNHASQSPGLGERPRPQNFRQHQFGLSGPGTRVPARRTRRGRLPELRFHAGAHQRARRTLFTDPRRFASRLLGTLGRLWTGADSGQHDRPRRGDARRRLGTLRLLGHRRYDQHHHQGPRPQQRRSRSHDHGDRQQQQLRQRHLGQCLARHRQP